MTSPPPPTHISPLPFPLHNCSRLRTRAGAGFLSLLIAGACLSLPQAAQAQTQSPVVSYQQVDDGGPIDWRPRRRQAEKELKKIRSQYFRSIRNPEIRQIGITRLKPYFHPQLLPVLIEVFENEKLDVRGSIMEQLSLLNTNAADTTLGWLAVFDKNPKIRTLAEKHVHSRVEMLGKVPDGIKTSIHRGLADDNNQHAASAAGLAQALKLYEAIPALINAQVRNQNQSSPVNPTDSLANIIIATQTAFVSDLQPVVGDSAVAFDPTISVVTDGVVLSINDAYVTTYRVQVHNALVGLANNALNTLPPLSRFPTLPPPPSRPPPPGGSSAPQQDALPAAPYDSIKDTAELGYDKQAWWSWYKVQLQPRLAVLEDQTRKPPE